MSKSSPGAVMRRVIAVLTGICAGLATLPASAADQGLVGIGGGDFGVFESGDHFIASLEWRAQSPWWGPFVPWLGVAGTEQGGGYVGGGIALDVALAEHWQFVPSFGPVEYWRGQGVALGEALEFRSRVEIDYRFANGQRLGLSGAHISNAELSHRNPGTQTVELLYWYPL